MRKSYNLYGMRIALSCFWNLLFRKEQEAFIGNGSVRSHFLVFF